MNAVYILVTEKLKSKTCKTCKKKISGYGKQLEIRWTLHEHGKDHKNNLKKK